MIERKNLLELDSSGPLCFFCIGLLCRHCQRRLNLKRTKNSRKLRQIGGQWANKPWKLCATLHDIKWNDEKILSSYFLCTKSCLSSLEEALANWSEKRQKNTTTTTTHRIHENLTWNSLWCLAESSQKESQEAAPCRHIHHTSSYWCNVNPGLINHGWH